MKRATVGERQRGRAAYFRQLEDDFSREKLEQRRQLQRRVERRALQYQVMVETIELEKELESRRCKLCDLLRAEAWGLGHANWTERRCGRCWSDHADVLARQRHSLLLAPAATRGAPVSATRGPLSDADEGPRRAGGTAGGGGSSRAEAHRVPTGGRQEVPGGPGGEAGLFGDVPPDLVDEVMEALRGREAERLVELLGERALARHLGLQPAGSDSSPPRQLQPQLAPPPEQPYGRHYYHDAVMEQLDAEPPAEEKRPGADAGAAAAAAAVVATEGAQSAPGLTEGPEDPRDSDDEYDEDGGSWGGQPATSSVVALAGRNHRNQLGAAGPRSGVTAAPRQRQGQRQGQRQRQVVAGAVAGYLPEERPLPSKPRRVPVEEGELEEALRGAEQLLVFGRTQRVRSEALFYSQQLRSALADLRLLRRRGRKAEAVQPRDESGIKRIIREGRSDKDPSPATLRRATDPDSPYVDPPRRSPRWLDHIHPDRHDRLRVVDPVPWRPASAKVPPSPHTEGLQAAGDWSEYRYEWEVAQLRFMRVDDYRSLLRREREARQAWAEVQAQAHVLSGAPQTRHPQRHHQPYGPASS